MVRPRLRLYLIKRHGPGDVLILGSEKCCSEFEAAFSSCARTAGRSATALVYLAENE
jgi:hypothetical protein